MRLNTRTYEQLEIFPTSILSPGDSPANPTALPESENQRQIIVISGRRCLESLEKLGRPTSLAKMLLESSAWHSTKCLLRWKLKATPAKRLFCQLVPSGRRTDGIGFGLLPTPLGSAEKKNSKKSMRNRKQDSHLLPRILDLLHTPTAKANQLCPSMLKKGSGFLPTPTTNDARNATFPPSQTERDGLAGAILRGELLPIPTNSTATVQDLEQSMFHSSRRPEYSQCQASGSLNPRFVAQMMGYPPDWCEIEESS